MEGVDDAYPIDLARAYWSRDREQIIIWFPLWSETGEPLDGVHRPWCVGSLDASDWHATEPSLDLKRDIAAIVERRLEATRGLLKTLVAPPSAFAQRCLHAPDVVMRR
ncbi:MAG: hypothetical protein M3401_15595 [Actinomycetota bacterium]|nr:hypothetical protein [Actinomycetota bacterium]